MAAKYDVIVVGAGPGGTAAAKTAAQKNCRVLLLERARTPGDKQMSGSYLFRTITNEVFPGFDDCDFHKGQIRIGGIDFRWMVDNDEKTFGMCAAGLGRYAQLDDGVSQRDRQLVRRGGGQCRCRAPDRSGHRPHLAEPRTGKRTDSGCKERRR